MSSDDIVERLRLSVIGSDNGAAMHHEAADRIDRDGKQIKDDFWLRQELEAEVERLRAELAEYRGDPQCEAVGDAGAGVRCTRQAGHKGDHVGTLEEFWWTT